MYWLNLLLPEPKIGGQFPFAYAGYKWEYYILYAPGPGTNFLFF